MFLFELVICMHSLIKEPIALPRVFSPCGVTAALNSEAPRSVLSCPFGGWNSEWRAAEKKNAFFFSFCTLLIVTGNAV